MKDRARQRSWVVCRPLALFVLTSPFSLGAVFFFVGAFVQDDLEGLTIAIVMVVVNVGLFATLVLGWSVFIRGNELRGLRHGWVSVASADQVVLTDTRAHYDSAIVARLADRDHVLVVAPPLTRLSIGTRHRERMLDARDRIANRLRFDV